MHTFDLNVNDESTLRQDLERLWREAPPMRCGACAGEMRAHEVTLNIGMPFDLSFLDDQRAEDWLAYAAEILAPTYTGIVTYDCEQCRVRLDVQQFVSSDGEHFHFVGADEAKANDPHDHRYQREGEA